MKVFIAVALILLCVVQYGLWFGKTSLPKAWALDKQIETHRLENVVLTERNERLASEVLDLKQGLDILEEYARMELGFIKQGETFFQIIEAE